jgi:hypothetical protein
MQTASNFRDKSSLGVKFYQLSCVAFGTLRWILLRSPENQLVAGERFDSLLRCAGSPESWGCITTILGNSGMLAQVTDEEMDLVVGMLAAQDLNPTVLDTLKAMCSFEGTAVKTNQVKLATKIFDLQHGTDGNQLATFHMGPKGQIEFFFPGSNQAFGAKKLKNAKQLDKQTFLCSQLQLMAELCVGRNYESIDKVNSIMSIDMVVRCMQNQDIPPEIRSAFVRLGVCAFIDRAPQVHRRWDNMTFKYVATDRPLASPVRHLHMVSSAAPTNDIQRVKVGALVVDGLADFNTTPGNIVH